MKMEIKKHILFLITIPFLFFCNNEGKESEKYYGSIIKYDEFGNMIERYDTIKNLLYTFHENNEVEQSGEYINGNFHGKVIHYYNNGVIEDSGYYYENLPKGLFYFYKKNGKLDKILEYINVEGESVLNEIVYFNEAGDTIQNEGHSFRVEQFKDVIKNEDEIKFTVQIENSIFNDSVSVQIGNFDSHYHLQDSSFLINFFGKVPKIECSFKYQDKNKRIIRGIIEDYTVNDTAVLSRSLYFSLPLSQRF